MVENSNFKTSDTALACFLITEHFYLLAIDYSQPRYEYLFRDVTGIQEVSDDFLSGNALTDPYAFSRINKKLMRVIRKQIQWEED
ncbi:hypothetical protein LCGC14_1452470 [marine sediment metagenome]|uniref:DUF5659 domain-containing protein n=1 Tax=marine sediment metagenome TaxID=412755 RepID=A0A0F9LY62_9ZZZZ|nr:hypothetical protein [Pricia sp.]